MLTRLQLSKILNTSKCDLSKVAKFVHDMGMRLDEAVSEFERLLSKLGFKIERKIKTENKVEIKASRGEEELELIFRHENRSFGIPTHRTIVEIYCTKSLHEIIHERIRRLRCGG